MRFLKNVKRKQLIGMAIQVINCRHATWFHGRNKKICGKKKRTLTFTPFIHFLYDYFLHMFSNQLRDKY
jgi:hypothetical protein